MKKILYATLIIGIFLASQCQSFAKPYEPQVKGGFKSSTTTEYRYKPGKIELKNGVKIGVQKFDDNGNMIEMISYENNKISSRNKIQNKYTEDGLLSETVYYDNSGKISIRFTFIYDGNKNMVKNFTFNDKSEITEKGTYKYDKNNFLVEETHEIRIDEKKFVKGTTQYINDSKGNKIAEIAVHSSNSSVSVSTEVNLENNINSTTEKTESNEAKPDTIKYVYIYDDKGRIAKETRISFDGYKFIKGYKYDEFGNLKEQIYFDENDKPVMTTVFEYGK